MTEQAQSQEHDYKGPERITNTFVGILEYADALNQLGYSDAADRYHGLMNDLEEPFVQFDTADVLQGLLKIELTKEVDSAIQNAIQEAIVAAQKACEAFYKDTLATYGEIDFSNNHVLISLESKMIPIQSVSIVMNERRRRKQLVANTQAGRFDFVNRSRLFIDVSCLPAELAELVEPVVDQNEL